MTQFSTPVRPAPTLPARAPTRSRESVASLAVGILGITAGAMVLLGLVPDFWDGWRKYEGAGLYHVGLEVLPGLGFVVLGVLGLVGQPRFAAPTLLGLTLGYGFLWLHLPLQVIDDVGLSNALFHLANFGFYLQALGLATALVGAVAGLVMLPPLRDTEGPH